MLSCNYLCLKSVAIRVRWSQSLVTLHTRVPETKASMVYVCPEIMSRIILIPDDGIPRIRKCFFLLAMIFYFRILDRYILHLHTEVSSDIPDIAFRWQIPFQIP